MAIKNRLSPQKMKFKKEFKEHSSVCPSHISIGHHLGWEFKKLLLFKIRRQLWNNREFSITLQYVNMSPINRSASRSAPALQWAHTSRLWFSSLSLGALIMRNVQSKLRIGPFPFSNRIDKSKNWFHKKKKWRRIRSSVFGLHGHTSSHSWRKLNAEQAI